MNRNTLVLGALVAAVGGAIYFATRTQGQVPVAAPPAYAPAPQHSQYVPRPVQQMQPQIPQQQHGGINLNNIVAGAGQFVQNASALVSGVKDIGNAIGSLFGK